MDAVNYLIKGHQEIRSLFHKYAHTKENDFKKKKIFADKAIEELLLYDDLEEHVFYPAYLERGGEEAKTLVGRRTEEHRITEYLMENLDEFKHSTDKFDKNFRVLIESLKKHFAVEERDVFPKAKELLTDKLKELAQEMKVMEKELYAGADDWR